MDFYGFFSSVFILWLCCFLYFALKIADSIYAVYFSIVYVFIEVLFLIRQYIIYKR